MPASGELNYLANAPRVMGRVLDDLYADPLLRERVRSITFSLPHDDLFHSGVIDFLARQVDSFAETHLEPQLLTPTAETFTVAPRMKLINTAQRFARRMKQHGNIFDIPLTDVLKLYQYLWSVYRNVERIVIPQVWQGVFHPAREWFRDLREVGVVPKRQERSVQIE